MIKRLNPGDSQIPASGWNEMREFINSYEQRQQDNNTSKRNPFLITIKNNTSSPLAPLSIVKIATPTYSRTGDTFANRGIEFGTELNGNTPDSEENSVAVVQGACPVNGFVKAIADGCTPAFIYIEDSGNYRYAKPKDDTTEYLEATNDVTNIRVLWHATGTGKKEAYICIDATGEGQPLKVAAKMPNTDTRPEGAFLLDSTDTWLYADSIDSFAKQNDSDPPAIVNPCGYPIDRPVIIGKCEGFPGNAGEEESENSSSSSSSSSESPVPDAVAIACDVREFFVLNNGASSSSSSSSSSNQIDSDYAYGSLEYIQYDSSLQRWLPATGTDAYKHRLAVCQRDLPAGWNKEYRMPYFSPESNYGAEPWTSNDSGSSASSSARFVERCGVKPGEHEFSNERLDYHYKNGRYSYEPRFVFIGPAIDGGTRTVKLEIEGKQYTVNFPSARSATSIPDVYPYDQITVEVDASGAEPVLTAIDYPMDFAEDTIILTHSGPPGRGWQDVTGDIYRNDLGNHDILVWQNPNNRLLASWEAHICTCAHGGGSGGGGAGHICTHDAYSTADIQAKWYKKIKTGAIL